MKLGTILEELQARGDTPQANRLAHALEHHFKGFKSLSELKEMDHQEITQWGIWALNLLTAQTPQDITTPPTTATSPTSFLADYVSELQRRGASVMVNSKYRHLL
jgi:hypothetical protein